MDIKDELKLLMKEKKYSYSYVAKATALSATTVNQWANGDYPGDNDKIADAINNFLRLEEEKSANTIIPFTETSVYKYVNEVARFCHIAGELGVCYGRAGFGKTISINKYAESHPDTILIRVKVSYNLKALLLEMHLRLGLSGKGTVYHLMKEVERKLRGSGRLIIVDEAEHLPYKAIEALRQIQDETGVGLLLVGMPVLIKQICGTDDEFEQLFTRVGLHKEVSCLLPVDVKNILKNMKEDIKLWECFWKHSNGNTRRLSKLLLRSRNIAKFNNKPAISEQMVEEAAHLIIGRG